MKMKIYNFLVNRHSGIRQRYHKLHDNAEGYGRIKSYMSLLGMNIQYYVFNKKSFEMPADTDMYEEKQLKSMSESAASVREGKSVKELINIFSKYDIISFDVFDTLLFRPFSDPTDLFFFSGRDFGVLDFKRIRTEQEFLARQDYNKQFGNYEISLSDIWKRMEREVGISAKEGMEKELNAEKRFCLANPFMLELFKDLREKNKEIICISDMYLSSSFVRELLEENGFTGIDKIYMSNEYGKSKSKGDLYDAVKKDIYKRFSDSAELRSIIHIGDNEASDVVMAEKSGINAYHYMNVNKCGEKTRAFDMSAIIGSAYRGIVNKRIYSGLGKYSPEYEYGYIYGGLFVLGYVNFIREYCKQNKVEKILFLSRDGDILKKVYDYLYPDDNASYTYISRSVAVKLMRNLNRHDFIKRSVFFKVNQKIKISRILSDMGLEKFVKSLKTKEAKNKYGIDSEEYLTSKNAGKVKSFLLDNFEEINDIYRPYDEAAKLYYCNELKGIKKAAVVDIGWAGSAAITLKFLAKKEWKQGCEVVGIVAGTNTPHNTEPDASEIWLQSGDMVPYVFSQAHNRDVIKKHDPNKYYNVYWELLLSSPTRPFKGFEFFDEAKENAKKSEEKKRLSDEKIIDISNRKLRLKFGEPENNEKGLRKIQKGIMDFVKDYTGEFKDIPFMQNISGRDACAPLILASGNKESYLKKIAARFDFKIDMN